MYICEVIKFNGGNSKLVSLTAILEFNIASMEPLFCFIILVNHHEKFVLTWKDQLQMIKSVRRYRSINSIDQNNEMSPRNNMHDEIWGRQVHGPVISDCTEFYNKYIGDIGEPVSLTSILKIQDSRNLTSLNVSFPSICQGMFAL